MKILILLTFIGLLSILSFLPQDVHATSYNLQTNDTNRICEAIGGSWSIDTCTLKPNQSFNATDTISMDPSVKLAVISTFTNYGTINGHLNNKYHGVTNNFGSIDSIFNNGILNNYGSTRHISNAAKLNNFGGANISIYNIVGGIVNSTGSTVYLSNMGKFYNSGSITGAGSNSGTLWNYGTILAERHVFSNDGIMVNEPGGLIYVTGDCVGYGTFSSSNTLWNNGIIRVGCGGQGGIYGNFYKCGDGNGIIYDGKYKNMLTAIPVVYNCTQVS